MPEYNRWAVSRETAYLYACISFHVNRKDFA